MAVNFLYNTLPPLDFEEEPEDKPASNGLSLHAKPTAYTSPAPAENLDNGVGTSDEEDFDMEPATQEEVSPHY